jgi:ferredoxin--NADP+ reductase
MKKSNATYNASVEIVISSDEARVIRVYPDGYKMKYKPGQYGSLGLLKSDINPEKLVKRAFCISSSMINISDRKLINHEDIDYYEFYFNKVPNTGREQLTPKLFGLNNGDRLFCGEKIVGYYTTDNLMDGMNILLLGTTTGESPNNSIVTELLLHERASRICNISVGPPKWKSLYMEQHQALMKLHSNYLFRTINTQRILDLENLIASALKDEDYSINNIGFNLNCKSSHIFLSGDPAMIGAPKKKGRWEYEHSKGGVVPIITANGFEVSTRFKPGNVEYECYW